MPQHEFVLWVIGARHADRGAFVYDLPANVSEVHEVFLDDALDSTSRRADRPMDDEQMGAVTELVRCGSPDWRVLFDMFQRGGFTPAGLLTELCRSEYPYAPFSQAFHTSRSMLLPLLFLLGQEVPRADLYHTICTGYGGLLGVMGNLAYDRPLICTEHGIYSREREEELIRAEWVAPAFKRQWTRFFYMLSDVCYLRSAAVTCLFDNARRAQIDLGAAPDACHVISNGIDYERYSRIAPARGGDWVDIGAIIRLAPIKDVKTLIYAFHELSGRVPNARLHILGDADDAQYAGECRRLAAELRLDRLEFAGLQDVPSYMEGLDLTVLTSISEGQPLSVLESMAAGRPCVTTDVGSCRELLEGAEGDDLGAAGFCVAPMNRGGLADAMERLCLDEPLRRRMGEIGRRRVGLSYRHETMMGRYESLYRHVLEGWSEGGARWRE